MRKAKLSAIEEKIFEFADPLVANRGFDLVDVSYAREQGKLFLRLFCDKRGGITVDQLAEINEFLDPLLDEEFQLQDLDYFEVSSPGLTRPLTGAKDFARYAGEKIEVKTYAKINGSKNHQGVLLSGDDQHVCIEDDQGQKMDFELKQVAKIERVIEF